MVEIINTQVSGLERAINAISNSFTVGEIDTLAPITDKKLKVGISLGNNRDEHQSHDAYLKGITVTFDIKYPQYWTPEFQRYHFADIIMSQSTMHSLKKFFAKEKDSDGSYNPFNKYTSPESIEIVKKLYLECEALDNDPNATSEQKYVAFMKLRSSLPAGFEMWETITTNYLQLKTIWIQRHNHKLKEDWGVFCKWIESLPHFEELCIAKYKADEAAKKAKEPMWTYKPNSSIYITVEEAIEFVNKNDTWAPGVNEPDPRSNLKLEKVYRNQYDTDIIEVSGGKNGNGDWSDYLEDLSFLIDALVNPGKELIDTLAKKEHTVSFKSAWVVLIQNDPIDDVFTAVIGVNISNEEKL